MIHRFIGTSARLVQNMARQPVTWSSSAIKTARGILTTAQHTLTVFGLSAVGVLALLYCRPDVARQVSDFLHPQRHAVTPLAADAQAHRIVAAPAAVAARPASADNGAGAVAVTAVNRDDQAPGHATRQQKYVTDWLSRRYRVAGDAANMLVSTAYSTAHDIKLDPLLILAVMAIESGLNPFAESPVGAQGLMQVMAKVHRDKFAQVGGAKAALNPVANIRVGALILKDYVKRTGSVEGGLKSYVGAGPDDDSGYGSKVLAEYRRLKQVAIGKDVPIYTTTSTPAAAASSATLAQKSVVAPVRADSGDGETTHGASQGGETVAGL
ncbi:lytic transglycosylase domain-containing protein [Massilia forsythiae]|uniref:Lytic transglycosylase domain-containing protein n=2 Tax=Massilia forsythiae TaxID=2728020 RepID=A0A7Z2VSW3_9BURK|nr:lytic transglycosylase domain-containing protein [Massilia forsythiae]